MERQRRIQCTFLNCIMTGICQIFLSCCINETESPTKEVEILFGCPDFASRVIIPDEEKISDISLMVFDERGILEHHQYLSDGSRRIRLTLLKGIRYSIYACANTGYPVKVDRTDGLKDLTCHLAYPDEYREGIPMYAAIEDITISEESMIHISFIRLMAKVSIRMDRSRLSSGVNMTVRHVRIGNCPRSVRIFDKSSVRDADGCFSTGFCYDESGCTPLNGCDKEGLSEEISLYMFENMQGRFSDEEFISDYEKTFSDNDGRKNTCSFIEMELMYSSQEYISINQPLIYRFYLGEDSNSLDIERNCHYHITVCPEDDGLKGDGWRVDKSGIVFCGKANLIQYPGDYIVGNIGDKIHIGCIVEPADAPFDIGQEYMEEDRAAGIYEYEIDSDGHGVTLTLTGPGRGLIYMEAGAPVNDAALFLIEVNMP